MNQFEIVSYCSKLLNICEVKDFCPNGLQVEGDGRTIKKIALGVSISYEVIEKAIEINADLILTHHGMIWDKDSRRIQGPFRKKIFKLLQSGIASAAYHLPLDFHPQLGNNIQLAEHLGLKDIRRIPEASESAEAVMGTTECGTLERFAEFVKDKLERKPLVLPFGNKLVEKVVIITGGAQNYFLTAVETGADCFLTGEVSEKNYSMSQEYEISFIGAGHYATEKYGIIALGEHLQEKFGFETHFIDIANPI
jgi:dinuclear metal center YbgI/SA1388 family protein